MHTSAVMQGFVQAYRHGSVVSSQVSRGTTFMNTKRQRGSKKQGEKWPKRSQRMLGHIKRIR